MEGGGGIYDLFNDCWNFSWFNIQFQFLFKVAYTMYHPFIALPELNIKAILLNIMPLGDGRSFNLDIGCGCKFYSMCWNSSTVHIDLRQLLALFGYFCCA